MDKQYDFVHSVVHMILYKKDPTTVDVLVELMENFQERELLKIEIEQTTDEYFIILSFKNMGGYQVRVSVPEGDSALHLIRKALEDAGETRTSIWKA